MELKDLIITPIYFIIILLIAIWARPYFTNERTRKYFIPALLVRLLGAVMLGVIYQFYYSGGDTFNYFTHGSKWIWEAFKSDPILGFKLIIDNGGERVSETFKYSQHIWYYRDTHSYLIVRITALFDLLTFHTYSATSLFFALFSFSGLWAFYSAVEKKYKDRILYLAFGILFVPSVVFWGSGILKDTITLGALGWLTWSFIHIIDLRNRNPLYWLVMISAAWLIYSIKIYILICFIPTTFFWLYWKRILAIRNTVFRIAIAPLLLLIFASIGYFSMLQIGEVSAKYSLDHIAERAAITAYDIRYGWGARTGGDGGYDIGIPDGTWQSMIKLMPEAINVTLFRPYPWEVKNPLMLLAALESLVFFGMTIWLFVVKRGFKVVFRDPFLMFCLIFALLFAFAVGVSTANFGTLMRYKIPMMPFFLLAIGIKKIDSEASK